MATCNGDVRLSIHNICDSALAPTRCMWERNLTSLGLFVGMSHTLKITSNCFY